MIKIVELFRLMKLQYIKFQDSGILSFRKASTGVNWISQGENLVVSKSEKKLSLLKVKEEIYVYILV